MTQAFKIGDGTVTSKDLASSIASDMKENHFDTAAAAQAQNLRASLYEKAAHNPDQMLDPTEVDENMFEFPSQAEEAQEEGKEGQLMTTADIISGVVKRNEDSNSGELLLKEKS